MTLLFNEICPRIDFNELEVVHIHIGRSKMDQHVEMELSVLL